MFSIAKVIASNAHLYSIYDVRILYCQYYFKHIPQYPLHHKWNETKKCSLRLRNYSTNNICRGQYPSIRDLSVPQGQRYGQSLDHLRRIAVSNRLLLVTWIYTFTYLILRCRISLSLFYYNRNYTSYFASCWLPNYFEYWYCCLESLVI